MSAISDGPSNVDHLQFSFWLSDAKPLDAGVPSIGSTGRVGKAVFWPPENGRPFSSPNDFVVLVLDARPLGERASVER
ncbi:MAG: hypothetical protein ACRED3_19165, partial [Bradyrhizobium sp.]